MRRLLMCILAFLLLSTALTAFSQQTDIRQFAAFGAYSYLNTPSLNLTQHGFDGDLGYNVKPWLTFGFDFSYMTGSSTLLPTSLSPQVQAALAPLAKLFPPGYVLAIPFNAKVYTYEAGPQLNYRHFKHFTFFVRPALGALHDKFEAVPADAIQTGIVGGLLGGKLSASDTVPFYGFGGGVTWEITPHVGIRFAADFARYNFFSDKLNGARNSVRLVVGTKFGFGKNILEK